MSYDEINYCEGCAGQRSNGKLCSQCNGIKVEKMDKGRKYQR